LAPLDSRLNVHKYASPAAFGRRLGSWTLLLLYRQIPCGLIGKKKTCRLFQTMYRSCPDKCNTFSLDATARTRPPAKGTFGKSLFRRREDARLGLRRGPVQRGRHLTGRAHDFVVRSPHAHARIVRIGTTRRRWLCCLVRVVIVSVSTPLMWERFDRSVFAFSAR
jgi:hypothetical protein